MSEFRLIARKDLDLAQWDELVQRSPNGKIYDLSFYLDAVAEDWMAICKDDYSAGTSFAFKNRAGYKNIYQPFFHRQFGLLSLNDSAFIEVFPKDIKHIHWCSSVPDLSFPYNEKWMYQELMIDRSLESIRKSYSENARRMIKKSELNAHRITESDNVDRFIQFFRDQKGDDIKEFKKDDYERLRLLLKGGIRKGLGKIVEVRAGEELIATGFFWFFKDRITYLKGTASKQGRNEGAMFALFDYVISTASFDAKILDFGGSRIPAIAQFYKRFGAQDVYYYSYQSGKRPWYIQLASSLKRRFQ
ncbi:MAG: GNAT family N-acetyltransferase [Flavobacteriales bacterium]|nr:GNAT family N-acetyltransferase [Flavobacteriales bacterium]